MNEYEGSTEVIKKTSASLSIQTILHIIAKLYKPAPLLGITNQYSILTGAMASAGISPSQALTAALWESGLIP